MHAKLKAYHNFNVTHEYGQLWHIDANFFYKGTSHSVGGIGKTFRIALNNLLRATKTTKKQHNKKLKFKKGSGNGGEGFIKVIPVSPGCTHCVVIGAGGGGGSGQVKLTFREKFFKWLMR